MRAAGSEGGGGGGRRPPVSLHPVGRKKSGQLTPTAQVWHSPADEEVVPAVNDPAGHASRTPVGWGPPAQKKPLPQAVQGTVPFE